jgi:soluble lytic murein transglycosylase
MLLLTPGADADARSDDLSLFSQRELYKETLARINKGQSIRKQTKQLADYPLRPYLDYHALNRKLYQAKPKAIKKFQETHGDLPVTRLMYNRWLRNVGKRRQWQTLLDNYIPTTNAELQCYRLRAMYGTGKEDLALDQTTELWQQPSSQPKACDPLFDVWRGTPRFTQDVAWLRLERAIAANQRTLARYLLRFFTGDNKTAADAFYAVHVTPTRITRRSRFSNDSPRMRDVIEHGIARLASRDPEKASKAWAGYSQSHAFSDDQTHRIDANLTIGFASHGKFPNASERGSWTNTEVILAVSNAAITHQAWDEAVFWVQRLEAFEQQKVKWQYWLARALQKTDPDSARAQMLFTDIAGKRHYYGFLAASRLGLQGALNDSNNRATQARTIVNIPGIERSVELFAVGDDINGRREWYKALESMNQLQQASAGHLARSIGRVPLSIRTANIADALDDLTLRFPMVYEPQFRRASAKLDVPLALLFAIARQESAFDPQAVSPANARGLMQMLPSTATLIARRAGLATPTASQLHDPGTNISLGAYHVAWLLQRYKGQTPLAIAAYNAGEHRVDRWIKDFQSMPMDVWVERIPFTETQNYVKNVLAFKHVYSQRLAMPTPMLGAKERSVAER